MKIKSHFEDVDQLNAKIKAVTIKNEIKQAKFSAIGYPPQHRRSQRGAQGARAPPIEMLPMIKTSQKKTIVSSVSVSFSIFAYNSN